MAVAFIYMAFILHFFPPSLSLSCQPVKCGKIDIGYPFYTSASPTECKGKFLIECDVSAPVIQFMGINYNVRSISYPDQVITIQDPALNGFFFNKQYCSFLFNFLVPIPDFNVSSPRPVLYSNNPFTCTMEDYNSFIDFFHTTYNYTLCRDYSLYYWNESEYQLSPVHHFNCSSSRPNLFEWTLSFREDNKSLSFSLLSAGFSSLLEFRKECFNCQLIGNNCSGNVTSVEHTCLRKEVFSPMDASFTYLVLILLTSIPSHALSCPDQVYCGKIIISYPFFINTTTLKCRGNFPIECHGSVPMIQIKRFNYTVKNISYPDNVITIQDPPLGEFLSRGKCGFLYNFTVLIYNFHLPLRFPPLYFVDLDCEQEIHAISEAFFPMLDSSNGCNDYNLYYWDEPRDPPPKAAHSTTCVVAQKAASFEWKLSFGQDDDHLSLPSAGVSRQFKLREDCLYCQATGKKFTSNGAANLSCSWENICKSTGASNDKRVIIGSVVAAGFLLVCLSVAFYIYKHRKVSNSIISMKKTQNIEAFLEEYGSLAPKRYSYSDVKKITKGFQEKLGQGGFGTVYKGTLINGHNVAVKILNDSKGDGEEFMNEVASIGRTSHVNVVSLLGFCSEGSQRALIYDFMCNGSLEKLLYLEKARTSLDWEKLFQIALGIARGLEYLHRGCNTRIVHFDIKPHNILLDQDFCPKISDFGLAKLCLKKDSIISIAGARGTIGYIAPEVFSRNFGVVSTKSDVYSYGMMLLEMSAGRKNANAGVENSSEIYFPHWIYEHLDRNADMLSCGATAESEETVRKMILIGLWCIQTIPQNRPPMSRVIEMFEGSVNDLQVPPKPYLSSSPFGSFASFSSIQDISVID